MEPLICGSIIRHWCGATLCVMLTLVQAVRGQSAIPDEYQVRAAIILNLAKFVVWPASRTADPRAPFVVGLLGYNEQSAAIERAFAGRTVGGRPAAVRRISQGERVNDCFMIYVAATEQRHYEQIAAELARAGVLTVSDDERFVFDNGVVGLPLAGDHVQIQINLARAQSSGLTISSRLLQLATVVGR